MVGRQLLGPRSGSIAEDEVAALLRRMAFTNRPLNPDDIGADFVCSLAKRRNVAKDPHKLVPMVYAGEWFLVSVKSGNAKIGLEKELGHFDWFMDLEIPFLVAKVEPGDELWVSLYQTLPQIACIKNAPDTIKKVEFKTEVSHNYRPRTYYKDRLDVFELKGDTALAWLGPPVLRLNRQMVRDDSYLETATNLLEKICNFHPSVRSMGRSGLDTGVFTETNKSIETPVRSYDLVSLVLSTSEVMKEIEEGLKLTLRTSDKEDLKAIWYHSQHLFGLYESVKLAIENGEIAEEEDRSGLKFQSSNTDYSQLTHMHTSQEEGTFGIKKTEDGTKVRKFED